MDKKQELINKLFSHPIPKNFTTKQLDNLMKYCECEKYQGGRGSGLKYFHAKTGRILSFDGPHPGNELYIYHVKATRKFLQDIGEYTK